MLELEIENLTIGIGDSNLPSHGNKNAVHCTKFCSGFNSLNCRFGKEEEFLSITCLCVRPTFTYQVQIGSFISHPPPSSGSDCKKDDVMIGPPRLMHSADKEEEDDKLH
ncbi:hypothetical protein L2E82_41576 [Cichorium intybus]|uniref:Uncharacterized protein n=1 Tax=Cichorium intybus TaxID=13427 RepID=A0ACB9AMS4_CICIN|nr:hypothetical protein L2E82_41576 [Cichorium intybus]